ncbi:hypothetical protein PM082_015684 [Marasmius tenuissimus]|nr:hypothetical protein PM082_015684 [Marasmius tenuissimus]
MRNCSSALQAEDLLLGFENRAPTLFNTTIGGFISDALVEYNTSFNRGSYDWFYPLPVGDAVLLPAPRYLGMNHTALSAANPLIEMMEHKINCAIALKPDVESNKNRPRTYFSWYLKNLLKDFILTFNVSTLEIERSWITRASVSWFVVTVHVPNDWPCPSRTVICFCMNDKYLATLSAGFFYQFSP